MSREVEAKPIRFACHKCGASIKAKRAMAGRAAKCPKCASAMTVPNPQVVAEPFTGLHAAPIPVSDAHEDRLSALVKLCNKSRRLSLFERTLCGRLLLAADLPNAVRATCLRTFSIPNGEELVAFVDTGGFFMCGCYGFAITENGVRWINAPWPPLKAILFSIGQKRSMTWPELAMTPLRLETGFFNLNQNDIVFGGFFTRFSSGFSGLTNSNKPLYELLLELQSWCRQTA